MFNVASRLEHAQDDVTSRESVPLQHGDNDEEEEEEEEEEDDSGEGEGEDDNEEEEDEEVVEMSDCVEFHNSSRDATPTGLYTEDEEDEDEDEEAEREGEGVSLVLRASFMSAKVVGAGVGEEEEEEGGGRSFSKIIETSSDVEITRSTSFTACFTPLSLSKDEDDDCSPST